MRIPKSFSEELRNQADIVRIVSDYVALKKRGRDHAACCPFHHEKTPSFYVSQSKQIFKCFGCSKGGSVFDFVMEIENCSFPEAVKTIADKCGVAIPVVQDDAQEMAERDRQRADLLQINQWATEFFEQNLNEAEEGRRALDYLAQRGITDETRQTFRLGYSPDSWDALADYLRTKGAAVHQIESSGLVVLRDGGGFYDKFRGRLMFPICDTQGRVVAFGGRILGEGEPKYLNSPETAVYTKGNHLFGLSHSRDAIRRREYAILVEGYLDFLMPFQAGVRPLVASLGTALTEQQVRLLARYARRVVVNFDPDSAGVAATKRSLELLLSEGFKVNVLTLPDNLDPDEFIKAHGAEGYHQMLKNSQPFLDYIVDQAVSTHDLTRPTGKIETINAILPYLKLVKDKIERAEQIERIADRIKIDSRLIREEFKRAANTRQETISARAVQATLAIKPAEQKLLEILLHHQRMRQRLRGRITEDDYGGLRTAKLFQLIFEFEQSGLELSYPALSAELEDEDMARELLPKLLLGGPNKESEQEPPLEQLEREVEESLYGLRCSRLAERQAVLQAEINQSQRDNDSERLQQLALLKFELAKQERGLAQDAILRQQ